MNDPKLPMLDKALDARYMTPVLEKAIGEHFSADGKPFSFLSHAVLKHKTGKHCVILYEFEIASRRHSVIGKIYRNFRGKGRYRDMRHLWEINQANSSGALGMPRPLAYLDDIGMVLQTVVTGRQLSDFAFEEGLIPAIKLTAENLATLHGLPVNSGEQRLMPKHIQKYCHPGPVDLMAEFPQMAPLVKHILRRLDSDRRVQDAPLRPVHGDLGLSQIFIEGNRAVFIDFDGFCQSHPALDAGNFLVALEVYFPAHINALESAFMKAYLEHQPANTLSALPVYKAFAWFRRAMICYRKYTKADQHQQIWELLKNSEKQLSTG